MQISLKNFPLITPVVFCLFGSFFSQAQDQNIQRDPRVDSLLNLKVHMQKNLLLGDNYTAQIYSGSLTEARAIVSPFKGLFPQWPVIVHYETPNDKVWVCNVSARLSEDRAVKDIQRKFPTAFLFKPSLIRKERSTATEEEESDAEQPAESVNKNG